MVGWVSLHVPKCAGSSLGSALVRAYGQSAIYSDLAWSPGNPLSPGNLDPEGQLERYRFGGYSFLSGKEGVHGHFDIRKYDFLPGPCLRFTFLRHPVARTISHYRYWQGRFRPHHPLQSYMRENRLSLLEFARLPIIRYFYSRTFFGGVDRSRFDFVGSTERMERDLPRLAAVLGRPLHLDIENVTSGNEHLVHDAELAEQLENLLAEDVDHYRRWTEGG